MAQTTFAQALRRARGLGTPNRVPVVEARRCICPPIPWSTFKDWDCGVNVPPKWLQPRILEWVSLMRDRKAFERSEARRAKYKKRGWIYDKKDREKRRAATL